MTKQDYYAKTFKDIFKDQEKIQDETVQLNAKFSDINELMDNLGELLDKDTNKFVKMLNLFDDFLIKTMGESSYEDFLNYQIVFQAKHLTGENNG